MISSYGSSEVTFGEESGDKYHSQEELLSQIYLSCSTIEDPDHERSVIRETSDGKLSSITH